jgi:mannose-6-phosphate isomerase-like protein (cupin superfamily)
MLRRTRKEPRNPRRRWARLLARRDPEFEAWQQAGAEAFWRVESELEDGFVENIERATKENTDFRRVLYTGDNMQLVVMSLKPGEEIGEEVHELSQFIRVEVGQAKVTLDGEERELTADMMVIVPEGVKHNFINTGTEELKLYSIYTPPQHPPKTVHKTKEEAEESDHE